jgi:hypothetical protein
MQSTSVDHIRVPAVFGGFARGHPHLHCVFLPVTLAGAASVSEAFDNPAFFDGGTHSGF